METIIEHLPSRFIPLVFHFTHFNRGKMAKMKAHQRLFLKVPKPGKAALI
jgi:hypothetical protein